jgi:hypothetical protein
MTDVTNGPGTVNPSGTPSSFPVFGGVRIVQSLVFCVLFCKSLFVLLTEGAIENECNNWGTIK